MLVECKSLLDSYGVNYYAISDEDEQSAQDKKEANRYKLFTNTAFREIVSKNLKQEYLRQGLIAEKTSLKYALAAGHIHSGHEDSLTDYFAKRGWILITPHTIAEKMRQLANKGWEDDLVTVTAKLILKIAKPAE